MSSQPEAIAIILARGGSKGLPHKNVLPVAGRPCIAWTIDAARSSRLIGQVVVSTDGAAIAEVARAMDVRVLARPSDLASDTATVDAAARHAVEQLALGTMKPQTPIVILYGNVPVRPAGLIDRAVEMMQRTGADSVQSYAPVGKYHPWWTARVDAAGGQVRPWEGDVLNHNTFRRQDLPPAYIPDGGVLVVTARALFLNVPGVAPGPHAFFGQDRRGILNREGAVVDIDSRLDLLVADAILKEQHQPA